MGTILAVYEVEDMRKKPPKYCGCRFLVMVPGTKFCDLKFRPVKGPDGRCLWKDCPTHNLKLRAALAKYIKMD